MKTDFLIAGAGPAGLILGIQLRKLGLTVQIIDRLKEQMRPVCGEYLSPQGFDYLTRLNLTSELTSFSRIEGMVIYAPSQTQVDTTFPEAKYGLALNRQLFQIRLEQEFASMGSAVLYDNAIETIQAKPAGFELTTKDYLFQCDYLIGADGRQSKVAKLLDFKTVIPTHKRIAVHCYLKPKKAIEAKGQMHILPDGSYIGINPISQNELNFSIVTTHEAIKDMGGLKPLINYWLLYSKALKAQFDPVTDEELKTTSPITRTSLEIVKGRAVLIGDASGFVDPLTGEGITTAIKSAAILAEEIANNENVELAFQKYGIRRKSDFAQKEKLNLVLQKVIASPTLCELIAQTLNISHRLKNIFIGVIGNIYTPQEAMKVFFSTKTIGD